MSITNGKISHGQVFEMGYLRRPTCLSKTYVPDRFSRITVKKVTSFRLKSRIMNFMHPFRREQDQVSIRTPSLQSEVQGIPIHASVTLLFNVTVFCLSLDSSNLVTELQCSDACFTDSSY
jgi:hypothetical protein